MKCWWNCAPFRCRVIMRWDPLRSNRRYYFGRLLSDGPLVYWEEIQSHPGTDLNSPLIQGSRWETARREGLSHGCFRRQRVSLERQAKIICRNWPCLLGRFFFHYLGMVHSAMPDAPIFHHTNYISGVKTSSTLIFCSTLFIILSKLILYYALRMKKTPT